MSRHTKQQFGTFSALADSSESGSEDEMGHQAHPPTTAPPAAGIATAKQPAIALKQAATSKQSAEKKAAKKVTSCHTKQHFGTFSALADSDGSNSEDESDLAHPPTTAPPAAGIATAKQPGRAPKQAPKAPPLAAAAVTSAAAPEPARARKFPQAVAASSASQKRSKNKGVKKGGPLQQLIARIRAEKQWILERLDGLEWEEGASKKVLQGSRRMLLKSQVEEIDERLEQLKRMEAELPEMGKAIFERYKSGEDDGSDVEHDIDVWLALDEDDDFESSVEPRLESLLELTQDEPLQKLLDRIQDLQSSLLLRVEGLEKEDNPEEEMRYLEEDNDTVNARISLAIREIKKGLAQLKKMEAEVEARVQAMLDPAAPARACRACQRDAEAYRAHRSNILATWTIEKGLEQLRKQKIKGEEEEDEMEILMRRHQPRWMTHLRAHAMSEYFRELAQIEEGQGDTHWTFTGGDHGEKNPNTRVWKRFAAIMPKNTFLKTLSLEYPNRISREGGRYIYRALRDNQSVEKLSLNIQNGGRHFSSFEPPFWLQTLLQRSQGIRTLTIYLHYGSTSDHYLAEIFRENRSITELRLWGECSLHSRKPLFSYLAEGSRLTSFSFEMAVDEELGRQLGAALASNSSLTTLTLGCRRTEEREVSEEGLLHLAEGLKVNASLTDLKLRQECCTEPVGPLALEALGEALTTNLSLLRMNRVERNSSDSRAARLLAANRQPPLVLQSQLKALDGRVEMKLLKMSAAVALTLLVDPDETRASLQRKIEDELQLADQRAVVLLPSGEALHKVLMRAGQALSPWTSTLVQVVDL